MEAENKISIWIIETGARILAARKALGWTQKELGRRVGVTKSRISRIETGKDNPGVRQLYAIYEALGVTPF